MAEFIDTKMPIGTMKAPPLKDSGERRVFESGAARDISDGKGRCDLLPLNVVGSALPARYKPIFREIECFKESKEPTQLMCAIHEFARVIDQDIFSLMLEVSKHFEAGALKYSENNWKKGIPLHCYLDSGVRHLLKHLRGDTDEPHDRAFVWNMLCAIWTYERRPELDDVELDILAQKSVNELRADLGMPPIEDENYLAPKVPFVDEWSNYLAPNT